MLSNDIDKPEFMHCPIIYQDFAVLPIASVPYPSGFDQQTMTNLKSIFTKAFDTNQQAIFNSCPRLY